MPGIATCSSPGTQVFLETSFCFDPVTAMMVTSCITLYVEKRSFLIASSVDNWETVLFTLASASVPTQSDLFTGTAPDINVRRAVTDDIRSLFSKRAHRSPGVSDTRNPQVLGLNVRLKKLLLFLLPCQ